MISFQLNKKLRAAEGEMNLDVSCRLEHGQLVGINGESGAGKTSILRMLAGLFKPDGGFVEVNGKIWFDSEKGIFLKPQRRRIGYVFQDYALFPNMTVEQNLAYALSKNQSREIIAELLETMALANLRDRKPGTLSGGQQQRVALARALVRQPEILLLDEPLSALDENMRARLQDYILDVHRKFDLTTILVSHDISELFKMAEKIFVLDNGKIVKEGSPLEIFSGNPVGGKFRFTGTVLDIRKNDVVYVVSVLVGNNLVKVVAVEEEAKNMNAGDKVVIFSKAFNPMIVKVG